MLIQNSFHADDVVYIIYEQLEKLITRAIAFSGGKENVHLLGIYFRPEE